MGVDFNAIRLRIAAPDEMEFLYALQREAMREHIERVWGPWDEELQRAKFREKTDPATHQVVRLDGEPIGCWWVRPHPDALELVRIYLLRKAQGRGIGTFLIRHLQEDARRAGKPIRLRVLKGNPALRLYERLGFVVTKRIETHDYMEWSPDA